MDFLPPGFGFFAFLERGSPSRLRGPETQVTFRITLALQLVGLALLTAPDPVFAAAPQRTVEWCISQGVACPPGGQPYAEDRCSTDPNIIFCEDFDYPQDFLCIPLDFSGNYRQKWFNPGLTTDGQWIDFQFCNAADFPAASTFPAPPSGSPQGGHFYRARPSLGAASASYDGCILGDCERSTPDLPTTYQNGSSATKDLYFRFQIYNTDNPDWYWPLEIDNKVLFFYPNQYTTKDSANVDAGLYFHNDSRCDFGAGGVGYNDAVSFRVGSNSDSFKFYPADLNANAGTLPSHTEYCSGLGKPNGTRGDTTVGIDSVYPPVGNPEPGTLFRMKTGRWYTVEFRYKLSDSGVKNGIIELWIDGVKVYSDNDLETCGNFGPNEGSCYALHEIFLEGSWYNPFGGDLAPAQNRSSYRLIDNFIISKSYIGLPGTDTAAPAPPQGLRKVHGAATIEELTGQAHPAINILISDPVTGSDYHLYKNGSYYTKVIGGSYRDPWVNASETHVYEIYEYRNGKLVGYERLNVPTHKHGRAVLTPAKP